MRSGWNAVRLDVLLHATANRPIDNTCSETAQGGLRGELHLQAYPDTPDSTLAVSGYAASSALPIKFECTMMLLRVARH